MKKEITFAVRLDNGHELFNKELTIYLNADLSSELTNELIIEIVNKLESAQRSNHGTTASVKSFSISFDEVDYHVENGRAEYNEDDELVILNSSANYLKWFADENDIKKAFENRN